MRRIASRLGGRGAIADAAGLPVALSSGDTVGFFERIEGAPLPVVRLFGWLSSDDLSGFVLLTTSNRRLAPIVGSRFFREDVGPGISPVAPFAGFRLDFLLEPGEQPESLLLDQKTAYRFTTSEQTFGGLEPHYGSFFQTTSVMGQDSIYGSGPPVDVSPEFKTFAALSCGRTLDFGCGNGDLMEFLAARGHQVEGLELDDERIRSHLRASVQNRVTLYDGGMPLPFDDATFDSVVSTEVIEHVPGIAEYVPELARILRPGGNLLVTTPDITSIPSSFPAGCVPWHLLESTHLNFFTPQSVVALFLDHFEVRSTYCLGSGRVNGFFVPGSIGVVFARRT